MIKWLRRLFAVVEHYENDRIKIRGELAETQARLRLVSSMMRDLTTSHVALNTDNSGYAVMIGHFRGQDYVQVFNFHSTDWVNLVEHMRRVNQVSRIGRFDAPPDFKGFFRSNPL